MAVFVTHIFSGKGSPIAQAAGRIGADLIAHVVTKLLPRITQENAVFIGIGAGVFVSLPIRKCRNHAHRIEALLFAKGDGIFKTNAGRWTVIRGRSSLTKWQPPGAASKPGIADHKERCAIGILQCMAVIGGAHKTPAISVLLLLAFAPLYGNKTARVAIQARIIQLVGTAAPGPGTRLCRHDAHDVTVIAIPKSVHALIKIRPLQLHPHIHVGVIIVVGIGRMENDLLHFPSVDSAVIHFFARPGGGATNQGE